MKRIVSITILSAFLAACGAEEDVGTEDAAGAVDPGLYEVNRPGPPSPAQILFGVLLQPQLLRAHLAENPRAVHPDPVPERTDPLKNGAPVVPPPPR